MPVLSVFSCSTSQTKETPNKDEKFYLNPIIKEESFENVIRRMQNSFFLSQKESISKDEFEKGMKEIFKEELIIDEDTMIYSDLNSQNKLNEFKNDYINQAYDGLIEEIKEDNNVNLKHWNGLFSKHTWETVKWRIEFFAFNLSVAINLAPFIGPIIFKFLIDLNFNSLISEGSKFLDKDLITCIASQIFKFLEWKKDNKCKSKMTFLIWKF